MEAMCYNLYRSPGIVAKFSKIRAISPKEECNDLKKELFSQY